LQHEHAEHSRQQQPKWTDQVTEHPAGSDKRASQDIMYAYFSADLSYRLDSFNLF
jgi:hypothetical protein